MNWECDSSPFGPANFLKFSTSCFWVSLTLAKNLVNKKASVYFGLVFGFRFPFGIYS